MRSWGFEVRNAVCWPQYCLLSNKSGLEFCYATAEKLKDYILTCSLSDASDTVHLPFPAICEKEFCRVDDWAHVDNEHLGPPIRFREYSFLNNSRLPQEVLDTQLHVNICKVYTLPFPPLLIKPCKLLIRDSGTMLPKRLFSHPTSDLPSEKC